MTNDVTGIVYKTNRRDKTVQLVNKAGNTETIEVEDSFCVFVEKRKYSITNTEGINFAGESFQRVTSETTVEDISSDANYLDFLVTGDTHLGYSKRSQDLEGECDNEAFASFGDLLDYAVTEQLDAILHVGDLFHGPSVEQQELKQLKEQLQTLTQNGVGFGYILGNHDPEQELRELQSIEGVVHLGDGKQRAYGPFNIVGYNHSLLPNIEHISGETLTSANLILAHPQDTNSRTALRKFCKTNEELCTIFVGHRHGQCCYKDGTMRAIRPGTVSGVTHSEERTFIRVESCDGVVTDIHKLSLD